MRLTSALKQSRWPLLLAGLACLSPAHASAELRVVAADQNLAWVAKAIGGDRVSVDYLADASQDPHRVDPRPSQVIKVARADVVIRIGMDLDMWLDSLVRTAGNSRVVIGGRGYVDASQGVSVLQIPVGKLDPSRGDIHIYGNPHYFFGPSRLPTVATNVAEGLKRADPANAALYDANLKALRSRVVEALPRWKAQAAGLKPRSVVTYHRSLTYLLDDLGLEDFGNVEPRPGLEPTTGHINQLARQMQALGVKLILTEGFRPRRFADLLAREAKANVVALPAAIGAEKGTADYFTWMDTIVTRLVAGK